MYVCVVAPKYNQASEITLRNFIKISLCVEFLTRAKRHVGREPDK